MTPSTESVGGTSAVRRHSFLRTLLVAALLIASAIGGPRPAAQRHAHLSDDLLRHESQRTRERARVLVHGTKADLSALASRHGLTVLKWLNDGAVLAANSNELATLAADAVVDHLSGDTIVHVAMKVSNVATAAEQARAGVSGLLGIGAIPGVTGQGVGVAVLDSGIAPHAALANKVVANVSFVTGDPSTTDAYGHGTHVAGIIAGKNTSTTSLYTGGIAPGVQLVNVRVLGANGSGYTSDVIAGIDWVIANRTRYNIRVMNLSLGHAVGEPASTDPLCEAVARAAAAGIVVVAAAGNDGANSDGVPILGGINSPGNSPFAITVGALNTWGTTSRSDDTVTSYSSRGPTRFDLAVKPDLAAPGNKIISLEADAGYLGDTYPTLHRAGGGNNSYMQLSGTSMATPIVTGAVALLLQGSPNLGTAQVKIALQAGATYVPDGGLLGAGAGSLNIWQSRKIAQNGLTSLVTNLLGGLNGPSGVSYWDAGTMSARLYGGAGLRLLSILDLSRVWGNPTLLKFGDLNLVGPINMLGLIPANNLLWGEVADWTTEQHILWGTDIYDVHGDHILWGTSGDDHIIWGTTVMTGSDPK